MKERDKREPGIIQKSQDYIKRLEKYESLVICCVIIIRQNCIWSDLKGESLAETIGRMILSTHGNTLKEEIKI